MRDAVSARPGERLRLFVTAILVYALCLTPVLFNPMTWTALDAAVSLVETGQWQVRHGDLYYDNDVAMAGSRKVAGPPPGLAFVMVPTYAVWRAIAGVVDTPEAFVALHVFATVVVGATASALAAGEVAALARILGAGVGGARWAAILFAFGTPAFLFSVRLYKENLAALIVVAAFRLALTAETGRRWALAGLLGGAAGLVAYPSGLIGLGVAAIALARTGRRALPPVALGGAVALVSLSLYNARLFGRPWRFAYSSYLNMPGTADVHDIHFRLPSVFVLVNSLLNQREGLFFYSPFLVLGVAGLVVAWRGGWRVPVAVTAVFALALWGLSAAWLAQFPMSFTGARYLFPAVPLLAAFAAPVLERVGSPVRWSLAIVSIGFTYLIVQAGHIADPSPLLYAVKTFVSGTGLPVLFKDTVPTWLGIETLHTTLARPDVSGRDLLHLLATPAGWRLAANQAVLFAASLGAFAAVAAVVRRVWTPPAVAPSEVLAR